MTGPSTADPRLVPYLPRLAIQWAAEDPTALLREEDGSLVFVDISGFTKMSERLARHGRVGAEEVTDVLGAVFARLLAVAYAEGAGLLKFGGDALLLWFSGDDHPARAARSAHGMRATLRSIGAVETTAGKVTLRMSIGVNSGRFHFFLVGGSHRELLITGPAATGTVRMENAATAGEILLGPTTAAMLPERILGQAKGPGRLLRSAPPGLSLEVAATDLPGAALDLEPYVPLALRESIRAGTEPEHRSATIAFVHFDGTDELIATDGPEAAAAALDELVRSVQEAVDEQGVCFLASDVDADGGKLILTAGVPRMVGDDEERMLLALRRIVETDRRLPVRIGVNRGPVFSGDVGPSYRRTYTVMGDPVNLAARLMAKAGPGQVFATVAVLDHSATRFETQELEPFMVKGKAKPVQAWAVGPAIGSRTREASGARQLSLIGRDTELQRLRELADRARAGQGWFVDLVGEPGIGKTRLLQEIVAVEGDLRLLQATAEAYTSSTPYVVWRELLRQSLDLGWDAPDEIVGGRLEAMVRGRAPDLLPWMPLLATTVDAEVPSTPEVDSLVPEFRRPKLHEVVRRFLERVLDAPTLIRIEDAHFMDDASRELLAALVRDLARRPWLVIIARRDTESGTGVPESDRVTRLSVGPLRADGARALVLSATEGAPFLPRDEEMVIERSGGNPQFLLDLIGALAAGSTLPDTVEAAAAAQIDGLSPTDRSLVRRASVFGVSFNPRLLGSVLGDGTPPPDRATWSRLADIFEEDGSGYIRYRRAVVRDAAYESLPFRTRRSLHEAVGKALEGQAPDPGEEAALLSLHFYLAGAYERAYRYARTAAARASGISANLEAAQLYQRAIEAARHLPAVDPAELEATYEALADAWYNLGEFGQVGAAISAAGRLARGHPPREARLLLRRSRLAGQTGSYSQALRWAARGRTVLQASEGPETERLRAHLTGMYAMWLDAEGRSAKAIDWARRAADEAERSGDVEALARAYNVLDFAGVSVGAYSGGEYWRRALAIHEQRGDLVGQSMILTNLGIGAHYEGQWDQALDYFERCSAVSARAGDLVGQTLAADNSAQFLSDRGRLDAAASVLRSSLRVWKAIEHNEFLGLCLGLLGRNCARQGRFEEALDLLAESRAALEFVGAHEAIADTIAKTAECHAMRGAPDEATETAREGLGIAATLESDAAVPLLELARGYALAQQERHEEAMVAVRASLERARARQGGSHFEILLASIAQLRLTTLMHQPAPHGLVEQAQELTERLGIVGLPIVPLRPANTDPGGPQLQTQAEGRLAPPLLLIAPGGA